MSSTWLKVSRVMPTLLLLAALSAAQMKPGDRRRAYGEVRASVMESVVTTLYPGAHVQWEPDFMMQMPGQKPQKIQVGVYVRGATATGGLEGVATIELDQEKEKFIFEAQAFRRADKPSFSTVFVVFRADMSGHLTRYKKIIFDPNEPVTEIKTVSIQDWSNQGWPILEVQYVTHRAGPDAVISIEWQSVFDAGSGQFVSRLPLGIARKVKGAGEELHAFAISRSSPAGIVIGDFMSKTTHSYNCSDPCVVDANTLLSQRAQ